MELIFGEHTLPDVILLNCMSFSNLSVTQNVINRTKPSTLSITYCALHTKQLVQIANHHGLPAKASLLLKILSSSLKNKYLCQ